MSTQNDVSAFQTAAKPQIATVADPAARQALTLLMTTLTTVMEVQNYIMSRLDPIQPLKATAASA